MEAEAHDRASDSPARRVLLKHEKLIGWQIASERAGFVLKVFTGIAGLAAALVLASMVWTARQSEGLVIKSFSMPPELAARGITGETAASGVTDELARMALEARSPERQRNVAADWGQNISIEIPNTGVSVSQVEQWLREKLGRQTRVTGEITRDEGGLYRLDARIGSYPLVDPAPAADVRLLVTKSAEAIFAREQPRSWFFYLMRYSRYEEALAFAQARAAVARTDAEVSRAYNQQSAVLKRLQRFPEAEALLTKAVSVAHPQASALTDYAYLQCDKGLLEVCYRTLQRATAVAMSDRSLSDEGRAARLASNRTQLARHLQDWPEARAQTRLLDTSRWAGFLGGGNFTGVYAFAEIGLHELGDAERRIAAYRANKPDGAGLERPLARVAMEREDWATALAYVRATTPGPYPLAEAAQETMVLASLGRVAEAQAVIAPTPLNCAPCVVARAAVAEAAGDRRTADHWFGEAARIMPSLPEAPMRWGRALLARGDGPRALAQFQVAMKRSPKAHDAIEGAGEALLMMGNPKEAAAMFARAAVQTPRWGRLHLKWGEALAKLGKTDEARVKWRAAATMDLSAADRAALQARGV